MALEKATITNTLTGEMITVMFNPETYSISKSNSFSDVAIPGLEAPIIQFTSGSARTTSLDLFFDTYEIKEDVRNYTKKLTNLMRIHPIVKAPPICIFTWGSTFFKCVTTSVTENFEMFLPSGIPVRAKVNIALKEYKTPTEQVIESAVSTAVTTVEQVVNAGDNISNIANKTLNDCKKWKEIAEINDIENPRLLEAGKKLNIPSSLNNLW